MISGCASYPFLPRGMVGLELDPIHKVLDRNDGLLVARHGPDSGTLYSTHAGCVYSFLPFVLSYPSPRFLPLCLPSSPLFGLYPRPGILLSSSYSLPLSVFDYR